MKASKSPELRPVCFDDLIARLGLEEGDPGGRDLVGDEYLRHGDGV